MSRRTLIVGLLVTLVLAGGVSYFASSDPDGLNKVAAEQGFDKSQKKHAAEDSPFAGYETSGVDNDALSGGLAGVVGVAVTFLIAGGVIWAVRRRSNPVGEADDREPVRQ